MILSAVRHGISDECNDSSSDSDSWTLFGNMTTTIANVLLNVIVLLTLCICYFTCKIKSTTTNNMELTSEYITRSLQKFESYHFKCDIAFQFVCNIKDKCFWNYFLSQLMCNTI